MMIGGIAGKRLKSFIIQHQLILRVGLLISRDIFFGAHDDNDKYSYSQLLHDHGIFQCFFVC